MYINKAHRGTSEENMRFMTCGLTSIAQWMLSGLPGEEDASEIEGITMFMADSLGFINRERDMAAAHYNFDNITSYLRRLYSFKFIFLIMILLPVKYLIYVYCIHSVDNVTIMPVSMSHVQFMESVNFSSNGAMPSRLRADGNG